MLKTLIALRPSVVASSAVARLHGNRRDMIRVAVQTSVAAAATYLAYGALGREEYLSWAVISALFAISVNTDEAVAQGLGRIGGAFLGVGLGLLVGWALPHPVALALALATALANTAATLWPSLRYAAMMAAIVALQPAPEAEPALGTAGAVLFGTLTGVVTTLVVLPSFGRHRASETLVEAIRDCEELLKLVIESVGSADRQLRDSVHARFLGHLETMYGQVGTSYLLSPALRSGAALREAALALEGLWHSIVILDRVVGGERHIVAREALDRLVPDIRGVQKEAQVILGCLREAIAGGGGVEPDVASLTEAAQAARRAAEEVDGGGASGIAALIFALDEIEARTLQLARVLRPVAHA